MAMPSMTLCGSPSRTDDHKRAWIALIGVADNVFRESDALRMISHFLPSETCPSASAQAAHFDFGNDLLGFHFGEHLPSARYPSRAIYSSMFSGSMTPQLSRTMRSWR